MEKMINPARMNPREREQIRFLHQHVEIRDRLRKEWRQLLLQCELTFFAIGTPLVLASPLQGARKALIVASLLSCSLSILTGVIALYAPVRAAADNAAAVLKHTKDRKFGLVPTSPQRRHETVALTVFPWLSALSFALILCALVASLFC